MSTMDIFERLGYDAFLLGQLKGLQDAWNILANVYSLDLLQPKSTLQRHIQELEAEARKRGLLPDDSQKEHAL